jgi:hypothetical protein
VDRPDAEFGEIGVADLKKALPKCGISKLERDAK